MAVISVDAAHVLSDKRILGYRVFGSSDLEAPTIFYFHAFLGSRLEAGFLEDAALSVKARIIGIDRPGTGISSHQPDRKLLDWPKDVLELADYLGIDQFRVLGSSGGAPHVLACCKDIPRSRLLAATFVSGLGPPFLGTKGMSLGLKIGIYIGSSWMSAMVAPMLDVLIGRLARNPDPEVLVTAMMKGLASLPVQDSQWMAIETFKTRFFESTRESLRHGSYGAAGDLKVFGLDWGFELEAVDCNALTAWHGKKDNIIPISLAEKMAARLPGLEWKVCEDDGHVGILASRADEVLRHLLASGQGS